MNLDWSPPPNRRPPTPQSHPQQPLGPWGTPYKLYKRITHAHERVRASPSGRSQDRWFDRNTVYHVRTARVRPEQHGILLQRHWMPSHPNPKKQSSRRRRAARRYRAVMAIAFAVGAALPNRAYTRTHNAAQNPDQPPPREKTKRGGGADEDVDTRARSMGKTMIWRRRGEDREMRTRSSSDGHPRGEVGDVRRDNTKTRGA